MTRTLIFISAILMIGCAVNSGVVPMGNSTYIVSRQAASGFHGMHKLKADAMKEAYTECQKQSKVVQVIEVIDAQPPYVLGNFPRTEIRFRCVDESELSISQPQEKIKSSGSGFLVSPEGIIGTNAHVVSNAKSLNVRIISGDKYFNYSAKVLLIDSQNDVALIKIDDPNFNDLSTLPYSFIEFAEIGESVFTIGYPLNQVMGTNYKVTNGIISSTTGITDDLRYYQITVPLQPGNSGGPLFNKSGDIVGITTAKLNSQAVAADIENVNYAIKISYLLNLYKMLPNSANMNTFSSLKNNELKDQVKILKNFVCLIEVN